MKKYFLTLLLVLCLSFPVFGADTKISGLDADTAPTSDDLVTTVNDPGGSPANKKVTIANLSKALDPAAFAIASQAAGDIFYAGSSSAWARLAKGTAYQVLHMNSGATAPEWTSTLGATGTRLTAGFFTDLTVTNAIAGAVTGNAATATALAADPADCAAGQVATGIAASGALSCTATPSVTTLTGNVTGNVSGNAGTVTIADAAADPTTFPLLGTAATGSLAPATDAGLSYDADTNILTAGGFSGPINGTIGATTPAAGTFTTLSSGSASLAGDMRLYDATDHYLTQGVTGLSANTSWVWPSSCSDGSLMKVAVSGATWTSSCVTSLTGLTLGGFTATAGIGIVSDGSGNLANVTTSLNPATAGGADLGTTALEWDNLYLHDGAVIYGQADQSNTLTSSATGWTANLNFAVTGQLSGRVPVATDNDGKTLSGTDLYGSMQMATGAGTWNIPDVDAAAGTGQSFCIYATGAYEIIVDIDAEDKIRLAGTLGAAGVGVTNASAEAAGDYICFMLTDFSGDVAHWTTFGSKGTWASQ